MDTGAWRFIWHAEDIITAPQPFINIWTRRCDCFLPCVRKKTGYEHRKPHQVFANKLHQDFTAEKPNQKWCIDFTYLFLKNHEVRYTCTILDLYDCSVIASITDRNMNSDLAIRTLKKVLESQTSMKDGLILHFDQGAQYTSKAFTEFCKSVNVTQSMSKLHMLTTIMWVPRVLMDIWQPIRQGSCNMIPCPIGLPDRDFIRRQLCMSRTSCQRQCGASFTYTADCGYRLSSNPWYFLVINVTKKIDHNKLQLIKNLMWIIPIRKVMG